MSDTDDVWRPSEEQPPAPAGGTARAAYGDGLWINQSFSLEIAARVGLAVLLERPLLVLGLGGALWLLSNLSTFLSAPIDILTEVVRASGSEEGALGLELVSALVTLGLIVITLPLQQLLMAGGLRAIGTLVETGETESGIIWRSVPQALRMFGNSLLVALAMIAAVVIAGGPLLAVAGGVAYAGYWVPALVLGGLGALCATIAYLYVALPLSLGMLACALDDAGPIEALQIAWTAGSGARVTLFVFGLASVVLMVAGTCLFCVGQIPVYGLVMAAAAGGWVLYARPEATLRASPFFLRNPMTW